MRNIKLTISYDGTEYSGWQFQKNGRSIQETVQKAIKKVTGESANLNGSGRTDSGVHAARQVANFRTRSKLPVKNIQMALNMSLPRDIVIVKAEEARPSFNSRHSARSKVYRYTIFNNDFLDPIARHYAAKCYYSLDMALMKKAAKALEGRHDFKAFQTKDDVERKSVRKLKSVRVKKDGDIIQIDMEADGFLYNMARNIAGTLVDVGRGKIPVGDIGGILKKKDRRLSGPTMPAKGLCLVKVNY